MSLRSASTTERAVPRMGVMRGATIIAPMTVAAESATTPAAAMTVARMMRTQNADSFWAASDPCVRRRRDIMRLTSDGATRPGTQVASPLVLVMAE